ncbi:FAD-dependent oxidoreductase [Ovoidimarina sediminis]|uniref:FAD-dependent oxidoreductase n=1 Tax=Ovoidimarina sediminis TaxID=3079856 RepID=UPI00290DD4DC|nr:FAD-dependent oxidoreductase [Rhodophyticola sp. MJ-SS7]MDU8942206.1 FAD-dependent oxidoreductase [Rhodophyticola sp. MJ-SS7]
MVGASYTLAFELYPYAKVTDQDVPARQHPVIVIGGGPIGMAVALDLGRRGTPVLVLDDHDGVGQGSRAICFAKRTLEIAHRLGAGQEMVEKGVVWNVGRVFHGQKQVFEFNLLPEDGHRYPAFINLQQPYFEKFLFEAIERARAEGAPIEIRGRNEVVGLEQRDDGVRLSIDTPDGLYEAHAEYVVVCDGARSPTRQRMGLSFDGRVFEDNFLIADVKMAADFPTERWFWFEPPFEGAGQSALLHKQPDNIWRIDFQLGWDIDRAAELDPERVRARVDAMLSSRSGDVPDYELEWTSIYTFQCRRMERFRHGRVLFAGDAAHQVSPFGARGANSGIQDADNLGWKLDLVLRGLAPDGLLDSYSKERVHGADENILNSTRSTDFLTPKTEISQILRNAVLDLAGAYAFARPLVNSGRLSVPCVYDGLSLNGPDRLNGPERSRVGSPCPDAPLGKGYLLDRLGDGFAILALNCDPPGLREVDGIPLGHLRLDMPSDDPSGALADRYLGGQSRAIYLIRPDQHVAARWQDATEDEVAGALRTALAKGGEGCL